MAAHVLLKTYEKYTKKSEFLLQLGNIIKKSITVFEHNILWYHYAEYSNKFRHPFLSDISPILVVFRIIKKEK